MEQQELIPHLFRSEYRKITAVLSKLFGMDHIETAEDIASETFLLATETWGLKGIPENPPAWLYTVAKNKARDYLRRHNLFSRKIAPELQHADTASTEEIAIDLSPGNIEDSQLQMMFAICHPAIAAEAQIGLSLRILCGFGIGEIAAAFLSNKETINKRLTRAREKLRAEQVKIELPPLAAIPQRLETVATTLYLLFNEGYYSAVQDSTIRKDLCLEAMRLTNLLLSNEATRQPFIYALLSLMCFQASRFDARTDDQGDMVLYAAQDESLWNRDLIRQGEHFLNKAARGDALSRYHLEAGIAYWHTIKEDTPDKWEHILQLYNRLLQIEYSPVAALNRTYALAMANGKEEAIAAAEKLGLDNHHLYHVLLAELYTGLDNIKVRTHLQQALSLAVSAADKKLISGRISAIADTQPG